MGHEGMRGIYMSFSAYYEGFFNLFILDVTERVKNKGRLPAELGEGTGARKQEHGGGV